MNKIPKFKDFEGGIADTTNYKEPEYLIQPAKNDTGFDLVKKNYNKIKYKIKPNIKSTI